MLVRLLPSNIADNWDVIKYSLTYSLPPMINQSEEVLNNILTVLLAGEMQCWVSYKDWKNAEIEGVMTTHIIEEYVSKVKNLLIYSAFAYDTTNKRTWTEGLVAINRFADVYGCENIIGYTMAPEIIKVIKLLGGNTDYTVISIPVNREGG